MALPACEAVIEQVPAETKPIVEPAMVHTLVVVEA